MAAEKSSIHGWVLYDGNCGFCSRWVPYWEKTLRKRGFRIAPLQADWVADKFDLSPDELQADFRLWVVGGDKIAGADVYRYLMQRIWWAKPFYFISILPGFKKLFDAGYRLFADNRYRISRSCSLSNTADVKPGHRPDRQPTSISR